MKRNTLTFFIFILYSFPLFAQKCCVIFGVNDQISYEGLGNATISLIRDDTIKVNFISIPCENPGDYWIEFDYYPGAYTLRVEHEGYAQGEKDFIMKTKRNSNIGAGTIFLKKNRVRLLDEATVRPTHIKMVMRGDTIVYDARAFDLANGSMLDALVAQLPGTELKNGQIKVKGIFISTLLINGEDFFSGNPKVALENLPAYTVKNIKVYDRAAKDAYLLGSKHPNKVKDMVMDVWLKKEYTIGSLGNVEASYGLPKDRYMGKIFGLGYADHLRLAAYGNLNNINNTQTADVSGDWGNGWGQEGELNLQMGGIDYLYSKNQWKILGNVMTSHEKSTIEKHVSSISFFDTDEFYGRSASKNKNNKLHLITSHSLQYSGKRFFLEINPSLDYLRNKISYFSRQATFTAPLVEEYQSQSLDSLFNFCSTFAYTNPLLSHISKEQSGSTDWLIVGGTAKISFSFPNLGDMLQIYGSAKYRKDSNVPVSNYFILSSQASTEAKSCSQIMQFTRSVSKTFNYEAGLTYDFWYMPYQKEKGNYAQISPAVDYIHNRYDRTNILFQYRETGLTTQYSPSSFDSAKLEFDLNNSHYSVLDQNNVLPSLVFYYLFSPSMLSGKQYSLSGNLRVNIQQERLHYEKAAMDTTYSRCSFLWLPSIEIKYLNRNKGGKIEVKLNYNISQSYPSIYYGLRTVNDADPINIYLNNTNLKRSTTHQLSASFNRFWSNTHHSLSANVAYQLSNRSVAQARYYNRDTGVSTWKPENISGNWSVNGGAQYTLPFGENETFQLQNSTSVSYVHSADYATETEDLTRSIVKNLTLSEVIGLTYHLKKHSFGISGNFVWLNARSNLASFNVIRALDASARANCLIQMPLDIQFSTELGPVLRRGYSSNVFNTTDWIWNASLSKSLFRGNLTFKLNAVDILGQTSQICHALNAQGRTETWTNTVTRYVMLHIIYRLNVIPKKK